MNEVLCVQFTCQIPPQTPHQRAARGDISSANWVVWHNLLMPSCWTLHETSGYQSILPILIPIQSLARFWGTHEKSLEVCPAIIIYQKLTVLTLDNSTNFQFSY
jgi:hypothetical protein